jgi:hypothetical protein
LTVAKLVKTLLVDGLQRPDKLYGVMPPRMLPVEGNERGDLFGVDVAPSREVKDSACG